MYVLKGKLVGVTRILFNRMTEEAIQNMAKRKGGIKKTPEELIAEAPNKMWRDEGGIYLPGYNLVACLRDGSKLLQQKWGMKRLWPMIEAIVIPMPNRFYFGQKKEDGIDIRTVKRGQKALAYRPFLEEGWELPFEFEITDSRIAPDQLKEALEFAGRCVGISAYRPRFGRFRVEWEE